MPIISNISEKTVDAQMLFTFSDNKYFGFFEKIWVLDVQFSLDTIQMNVRCQFKNFFYGRL